MPSEQYCSSPLRQLVHSARVHHAADADPVADLVPGDVGADLGNDPDDLVAGYDGEGLRSPVAVDGVDVGVADAGVLDLDEDVVGSDVTPLDDGGGQRLAGGGCGVGVDAHVKGAPCVVAGGG